MVPDVVRQRKFKFLKIMAPAFRATPGSEQKKKKTFICLIVFSPDGSGDGRILFSVISISCHHIHDFRVRLFEFNDDLNPLQPDAP